MAIVHCRYGDFSVPERNDLIFDSMRQYGEWAQQELNFLSSFVRAGDTVLDAGAFIGTHARAFAEMVGAQGVVHAFEPNQHVYGELLKNCQLAPRANIQTYQVGLGGRKQSRYISPNDERTNLGASALSEECLGAGAAAVEVKPLDDFNFLRVDFIKADVEGMEYELLVGGDQTIRRHKPFMFLEANTIEGAARIVEWAHQMQYAIFGHVSEAFNPDNFNRSTANMFGEARECGLLLLHRDRMNALQDAPKDSALIPVETVDDLALLLLHKPQYVSEVLGGAGAIGHIVGFHPAAAHDDRVELEKVRSQLAATELAKNDAEQLAYGHLSELGQVQARLTATESAKAHAEQLAHGHLAELEKVQAQLTATEFAKAHAEQLAHGHLAELEKVQARLTATESAKAHAEQLANARQVELDLLRDEVEKFKHDLRQLEGELEKSSEQLTRLQSSAGYKLLAAMRLVPRRGSDDV